MSSGSIATKHDPWRDANVAVVILGGHGSKDEGSERSSRSGPESDPFLSEICRFGLLEIYSSLGLKRDGIESNQLIKRGVYTNTSLAPSIAVELVCGPDKCDPRELLARMTVQMRKLDKLAGVKYKDPDQLIQRGRLIEDKNYWGVFMGEQIRQQKKGATKEMPARVAAGDSIHFPFGLTFLSLCNKDGNPVSDGTVNDTIASFMLGKNCNLRLAEFANKNELLANLKDNNSIVTNVVEPFAQSATKGKKTHWADLNLLSSKNSGEINRAIAQIASDAQARIAKAQIDGVSENEHDIWLVDKRDLVILYLNEVQATKRSKLSKIVFICKYIFPPNTIIQIVDQTCSGYFTKQSPWEIVTETTFDSMGSLKSVDSAESADSAFSAASSESSLSEDEIDAEIEAEKTWRDTLFDTLWSGWKEVTSFVYSAVARHAPDDDDDGVAGAGAGAGNKRHAIGGSRKMRKRTTVRRKKITRKTNKRTYKKKSQKRNRRK